MIMLEAKGLAMSEHVELAFDHIEYHGDNADAILFDFGEKDPVWIPKSQIDMNEFDRESNVVPVTEWFAKKEGLI